MGNPLFDHRYFHKKIQWFKYVTCNPIRELRREFSLFSQMGLHNTTFMKLDTVKTKKRLFIFLINVMENNTTQCPHVWSPSGLDELVIKDHPLPSTPSFIKLDSNTIYMLSINIGLINVDTRVRELHRELEKLVGGLPACGSKVQQLILIFNTVVGATGIMVPEKATRQALQTWKGRHEFFSSIMPSWLQLTTHRQGREKKVLERF